MIACKRLILDDRLQEVDPVCVVSLLLYPTLYHTTGPRTTSGRSVCVLEPAFTSVQHHCKAATCMRSVHAPDAEDALVGEYLVPYGHQGNIRRVSFLLALAGRAQRLMGPHGRFRLQLINRCYRAGKTFDDESISPVMRQVGHACAHRINIRGPMLHFRQTFVRTREARNCLGTAGFWAVDRHTSFYA